MRNSTMSAHPTHLYQPDQALRSTVGIAASLGGERR